MEQLPDEYSTSDLKQFSKRVYAVSIEYEGQIYAIVFTPPKKIHKQDDVWIRVFVSVDGESHEYNSVRDIYDTKYYTKVYSRRENEIKFRKYGLTFEGFFVEAVQKGIESVKESDLEFAQLESDVNEFVDSAIEDI